MKIKNDARIADDIAHGIKRAAGELKLSEVSCKTGTAPVEEECSRSYANGRDAVGDYGTGRNYSYISKETAGNRGI